MLGATDVSTKNSVFVLEFGWCAVNKARGHKMNNEDKKNIQKQSLSLCTIQFMH